jgi:3-hydroxyisobutyrate dehydrogenase-like beta-hydroxyacid dehydrogenase
MQLGMIGLGRMGANIVRRLLRGGHQCVVFDRSPKAVQELTQEKAVGAEGEHRQARGSPMRISGAPTGRQSVVYWQLDRGGQFESASIPSPSVFSLH